ncbi:MAG: EAL domain-containing protein (putative c-di-GMP-specific phosphodiesterase class I) [Phycisphaerales bacterium]|jgi:EAL domain-containing protein (putative c-di-GMP-specific phosphodiesterase class I)
MPVPHGETSLESIADAIIRGGLLRSVFQPIVDLGTGAVAGLECLSRPMGAAEGVSPGDLFSDQINGPRRLALEQLARRRSIEGVAGVLSPGQLVFINCSPEALVGAGRVEALLGDIENVPGLEPSRIVLEITEDTTGVNESDLALAAQRLRARGIQIALDDVGVGGNGLGRVSRIQPDWVKLDRLLIAGLDTDPERRKLVEFLTRLAGEIGCRVVAEGIETLDELATVVRLGISHGQGFGLGRPSARPRETQHQIVEVLRGAGVARQIVTRQNPLTGLPDRVECERRLVAIADSDVAWETEVAVVDVRDLHQINARHGYEQGDTTISTLGRELAAAGFGKVRFVGHAGDDRFLLLGSSASVEAVIDEVATSLAAQGLASIRGILMPGLLGQMSNPSDVFHLHSAVKARADERLQPGRAMVTIPMGEPAGAA